LQGIPQAAGNPAALFFDFFLVVPASYCRTGFKLKSSVAPSHFI